MKLFALSTLVLVGLLIVGCQPASVENQSTSEPDTTKATAQNKGLTLTIDVESETLVSGEEFAVKIDALNSTDKPLVIDAGYAAPYVITVQKHTPKGWENVNTYPQEVAALIRAWTFEPGKARTFTPMIIAEPSWPTHEPLRLEVKLNGRDDVKPFVTIIVVSKGEKK